MIADLLFGLRKCLSANWRICEFFHIGCAFPPHALVLPILDFGAYRAESLSQSHLAFSAELAALGGLANGSFMLAGRATREFM